jgi:hypothetical protein
MNLTIDPSELRDRHGGQANLNERDDNDESGPVEGLGKASRTTKKPVSGPPTVWRPRDGREGS